MTTTNEHPVASPSGLLVSTLAALSLALLASCGGEVTPAGPDTSADPAGAAGISVSPSELEVRPGESTQLTATVVDSDGQSMSAEGIVWSSSDAAIASVSADGMLTAHAPGSVTATATLDQVSGGASVSVLAPVGAVAVVPGGSDVRLGGVAYLRAELSDADGNRLSGRDVFWASDDPTTATVAPDGRVQGLADGQTVIRATSEGVEGSTTVRVLSVGYRAVSAGMGHTCALGVDGLAWCWGNNDHGQLGTGDKTNRSTPQPVVGGMAFTSIAAGAGYTCAVTATGAGYCWGDNSMMELGNRQAGKTSATPVPVLSAPAFAAVGGASNMAHSCGLTTTGAAFCWGYNRFGMVGNGSIQDEPYPLVVVGGLSYVDLSAAHMRTCAIATDGMAYCWGRGGRTQLGNPSSAVDTCYGFECSMSPRPVSGSRRYSSISTGRMHTCAVATGGGLFCWGENTFGQVGDGTTTDVGIPTRIAPGLRFSQASAGDRHSCGVADDGRALCWGENADGRLGDGTMSSSPLPSPVSGGQGFVAVSAGYTHTCALAADGTLSCWGDNMMGQLGDGSTAARLSPVRVQDP